MMTNTTKTTGNYSDDGLSTYQDGTSEDVDGPDSPTGGDKKTEVHTAKSLFKANLLSTITYCSVFGSFGMCVALLGPTLEDLGCQTGSTLIEMSWAFLAQSLSILIGSMAGGLLVDRYCADPILLVANTMIGITLSLIPKCDTLVILLVNLAIMGFFMGIIDTVANVSLLKIYGKLVSPFLQALHFCYGLGAVISPLLAEPFLLNTDCSLMVSNVSSNSSESMLPIVVRSSSDVSSLKEILPTINSLEDAQEQTNVKYAFWIMAAFQIPIVMLVLTVNIRRYCCKLPHDQHTVTILDRSNYEDLDADEEIAKSESPKKSGKGCFQTDKSKIVIVTFLTSFLLFLYDGLQAAYGGYIFEYAVKNAAIQLSATDGAYLTSVFWGSFALGRLVSIPISTVCSLSIMLFVNLVGCFVALSLELLKRDSLITLYVGSGIFGLFLSSIYPSSVAFAEQHIAMSGVVTSCIVIGAATGEMTFPVMVGRLLFPISPLYFLAFCAAICCLGIIVYGLLQTITHCTSEKAKPLPLAEGAYLWCRSCCLASRESLLLGESRYYTSLTDTNSAYKVVTTQEQFQMIQANKAGATSKTETDEEYQETAMHNTSTKSS
ncbi:major facilitator superfamily domain-containing protein 4A-like [Diadema setosum]|uniref:major facilitator superfamily domain-containing protein 4A-like n=1 Tax=Diadema setosum TaxID=31175 RepID=UPI003B3BE730